MWKWRAGLFLLLHLIAFFPVCVYWFNSPNVFSTLDPKHVRNKLIFFSDGFLVSTVYENEQTEGSAVYPDPGEGGTLGTSSSGTLNLYQS